MQDFYLFVNWVVAIGMLGLGLATLIKSRNLLLNKVFAFFTVAISVWIVASYISNDIVNSPRVSVIGNYFVFFFSYVSAYLLLWFAIALAGNVKAAKRLRKFSIPAFIIGLTNLTPLVVAGAERQGSVYAVKFGPLVVLYFISLVVLLTSAMVVLRKGIKQSEGAKKAHLQTFFTSMIVALPILLLTEFILPAITGWFGLTNIGITVMAIPAVGLYYSVFRLRLFNLRMAVARSLAYVITVALIGTLYGFVSYNLTTVIKGADLRGGQELLNVALIIIAVNVYSPMIRLFRRLTNSLFYRDAYNSQTLIDEFNKVLVSTYVLNTLLQRGLYVIDANLRPSFALFGVKETQRTASRIIGTGESTELKKIDVATLHSVTRKVRHKVIVTDMLEPKHIKLQEILQANDIAVLARLTGSVNQDSVGYLALGSKKSGNPYGKQDLKDIGIIANSAVVAIQNALLFEEIRSFNETLQEKVVEATRKLRHTNERLKMLDETKDDFISMASHQLRTPLTSVKGYISMVLEGDAGKLTDMQKDMLNQAFFSSQRMVFLIADLLNVSRLKTGKFVIEPVPVNLAKLVQEELEQLKDTAASRGLTIQFDRPADFPDLMLDETKTRQVIMNFVDNAIYYTPSGGQIVVTLNETPSSIELRVSDNGIGVPKSEQHHLFNKFYRAANARKARPDGTGLGLFMAKKVIVGQSGSVLFESTEGKGSTFGFVMSKTKLHVKPVQPEATTVKSPPQPAQKA